MCVQIFPFASRTSTITVRYRVYAVDEEGAQEAGGQFDGKGFGLVGKRMLLFPHGVAYSRLPGASTHVIVVFLPLERPGQVNLN